MRSSALPLPALALAALLAPSFAHVQTAQAATFEKWDQATFDKAQAEGRPVLLYIEASWCPTCAKQRPILSKLYEEPAFANLLVLSIDFDTQKDLIGRLGVNKQSTLIAYHGKDERTRATGVTDPDKLRALVTATES